MHFGKWDDCRRRLLFAYQFYRERVCSALSEIIFQFLSLSPKNILSSFIHMFIATLCMELGTLYFINIWLSPCLYTAQFYKVHYEFSLVPLLLSSVLNGYRVFITSKVKSLTTPAIWLALSSLIYSQIAPFSALNHIFFPANEKGTLKQHNLTNFKSSLL